MRDPSGPNDCWRATVHSVVQTERSTDLDPEGLRCNLRQNTLFVASGKENYQNKTVLLHSLTAVQIDRFSIIFPPTGWVKKG